MLKATGAEGSRGTLGTGRGGRGDTESGREDQGGSRVEREQTRKKKLWKNEFCQEDREREREIPRGRVAKNRH